MPRFFRTLICILLICCILVNVSPIRARAVSVGLTLGELLLLLGGIAGIVCGPGIADNAAAAETSFMNSIADASQEVKDGVAEIVSVISLFPTPDDFPDAPEDGGARDTQILLSRGILGAIATWLSVYAISGLLSKGETAPSDMMFYNGIMFPTIPVVEDHPYSVIVYSQEIAWCYLSNAPLKVYSDESVALSTKGAYVWQYQLTDGVWTSRYYTANGGTLVHDSLIWSSYDLLSRTSGKLFLAGSEPLEYLTEVIEPIFITEIPTLDDGSPDPEEIEKRLPLTIDPSKVLYDTQKATLNEAVQDVMQQLADGTMTHQQYVDSITPPSDPDVPVDPDPTVPSEDVWEPPENPGQFALDLSNYFPFCIPFDLYDFVSCLRADPVAPVIEWAVPLPGGSSYSLEIDFSTFDSVAQLLRRLQLLLFCVGLAFKTRDLIKG